MPYQFAGPARLDAYGIPVVVVHFLEFRHQLGVLLKVSERAEDKFDLMLDGVKRIASGMVISTVRDHVSASGLTEGCGMAAFIRAGLQLNIEYSGASILTRS